MRNPSDDKHTVIMKRSRSVECDGIVHLIRTGVMSSLRCRERRHDSARCRVCEKFGLSISVDARTAETLNTRVPICSDSGALVKDLNRSFVGLIKDLNRVPRKCLSRSFRRLGQGADQ